MIPYKAEIKSKSMEKLKFHTEQRKISELIPFEKNPRDISPEQYKQLEKSIEEFDLVEIPAIDTDNKIIAGHQRLKIMLALGRGDEIIDVRVPNRKLTQREFEKYNLRSNRNVGYWLFDVLKDFDQDLLTEIGFTDPEMRAILGSGSGGEGTGFPQPKLDEKEKLTCPYCQEQFTMSEAKKGKKDDEAETELD